MPSNKKIKKLPQQLEVEWKGLRYQYTIWEEYSPSADDTFICARGPSEQELGIQIGRMFGVKDIERMRELILCGFKNQETDRNRRLSDKP